MFCVKKRAMFTKNTIYLLVKHIRKYATKNKLKVEVNKEVINNIEEGVFKPRKHPGVFRPKTINLPERFVEAAERAISDYPVRQILDDSKILYRYLRARHPPIESQDYNDKRNEIETKILSEHGDIETMSYENLSNLREKYKSKILNTLKTKLYFWKPINYDIHTCLQYLLGRSAAEYAVLVRVFQEINNRDQCFKPRSLFDFGAGVGTGSWAAKHFWEKTIFEYFNVDSSVHMNDLALILLKGGYGQGEANIKGVFYRQFLPATNTTYDLVISAYSLLELPSSQARLETILKLWNKTQYYLILVEQGTKAGFKVINEARDFILQLEEGASGHVFSPCPHDKLCPKIIKEDHCNFEISYMSIAVGQKSELRKELFSYVILKKGSRNKDDESWPRLVEPTLVRSKHAICRLCTSSGSLEEIIFTTSKHGRIAHRCAKGSEWGDLLPFSIETKEKSE